jgi:uncharacterized protein (TIGR02996 family)
MDEIHRALSEVQSGRREAALGSLLAAWRAARAPAIADAIDALSMVLTPAQPPIRATGALSAKKAWYATAAAATPESMGRLLESLPEGNDRCLRLRTLRQGGPDPRVGTAARTWLEQPPLRGPRRRGFYLALVELLAHVGDVRLLPLLREMTTREARRSTVNAIGRHAWQPLVDLARSLATITPEPVQGTDAAELERIVALVSRHPADARRRTTPAALLAAVYARPDDDEPRAVLSDLLQELGDPRGEFIALQLARHRDGSPRRARERSLEQRWGRDWLGAIEPHVLAGDVVYERGFVSRCRYRGGTVEDVTVHPEWSTITHLDVANASQFVGGSHRLLLSSAVRALRHVHGAGEEDLKRIIAGRDLPWETLGVRLWRWDNLAPLANGPSHALPRVRRLVLRSAQRTQLIQGATVDAAIHLVQHWPALQQLDIALPVQHGMALVRHLVHGSMSIWVESEGLSFGIVPERTLRIAVDRLDEQMGQTIAEIIRGLGGFDRVSVVPTGKVAVKDDLLVRGRWRAMPLRPARAAAKALGLPLELVI